MSRRGSVLPFVLFALIVTELGVATAFAAAWRARGAAREAWSAAQALAAAEAGAAAMLEEWDPAWLADTVGQVRSRVAEGFGSGWFTARVSRLAGDLILIRGEGGVGQPAAVRRVEVLAAGDSGGARPVAGRRFAETW